MLLLFSAYFVYDLKFNVVKFILRSKTFGKPASDFVFLFEFWGEIWKIRMREEAPKYLTTASSKIYSSNCIVKVLMSR